MPVGKISSKKTPKEQAAVIAKEKAKTISVAKSRAATPLKSASKGATRGSASYTSSHAEKQLKLNG